MSAATPERRVVLFAGAGASKAVNPTNYPTTVEFFERLPKDIRSNPHFTFVEKYLLENKNSRTIDIEEVLWGLQTLLDLCHSIVKSKGMIGHALSGNRLANLVNTSWNLGHILNASNQLISSFGELISQINALVYDMYGESPNIKDIKDNWIRLLNPLFNQGIKLDIFTTNYDIIIETALESFNDIKSGEYFGLTGGRHKFLDIERWSTAAEGSTGLLTKLHGSLDWKVKNEKIYSGDPVFTGDHEKQGIIYPGFKGASNRIFFKPFHDYLERSLARADFVGVIGFAFRDEYISESIRNNLGAGAKVLIVNPDKSVTFPYRRIKPSYLYRGFDAVSADELARMALSDNPSRTLVNQRIKVI